MTITDTTSEAPPIRRFPEAPRPRQITVNPHRAGRRSARSIERQAQRRLTGLAMAAITIDRVKI